MQTISARTYGMLRARGDGWNQGRISNKVIHIAYQAEAGDA